MSNQVKLNINPNWENSSNDTVVVYVQAWHTSAYIQNVTITGPGIADPNGIQASSNPSTPFGTQFLNQKLCLNYPGQFPNWVYTVTITYTDSNKESDVLGSKDFSILERMVGAIALSNDGGSDSDYNDCVVQISAFKDTTDCPS